MSKVITRVVIPDSHGSYIDKKAAAACVRDIVKIKPDEIVFLGDHVDASGMFSKFKAQYLGELDYSYKGDIDAAKSFVTAVRRAAPRADIHYLEGNHEWHVERWIASTFDPSDARDAYKAFGPDVRLDLSNLGIKYLRRSDVGRGMSTRGVLRLAGCDFVHGIAASLHATSKHLDVFGGNVVHGHTHRAVSIARRRPDGSLISAHCPGTLAKLSPLYMHTSVTNWSHGYGLQFVDGKKLFHYNIPIIDGKTRLP